MNTHIRRLASSFLMWCLVVGLMWPGTMIARAAESDSGEISVEIVPPGSTPKPDAPTPSAPQGTATETPEAAKSPEPAPGILSATIMWLPDPADGQTGFYGLIAVQDHRAHAAGWTVRLLDGSGSDAFLAKVIVGGAGFGLPEWLYVGIHAWDVAVGAPLGESPQIVTAPQGRGYSLTIHQFWLMPGPESGDDAHAMQTLVLILPFAP